MTLADQTDETFTFQSVRHLSRKRLFDILDECAGSKAIVWDARLVSRFSIAVSRHEELKPHGVQHHFMLSSDVVPQCVVDHVFYVICNDSAATSFLSDSLAPQTSRLGRGSDSRKYHVVLVPTRRHVAEKRFRDAGLLEVLQLHDADLFAFCFDDDLLSMESPSLLNETLTFGDNSLVLNVSVALEQLQGLFGGIPNVFYKGALAEMVVKRLEQLRAASDEPAKRDGPISSMIVLDRTIDWATPMVSQLTYEGLIDETIGVANGVIKLPASRFTSSTEEQEQQQQTDPGKMKTIRLSSAEPLYEELRDLNFNAVGGAIRRAVTQFTAKMEERHAAKSVRDYKEFVKKLPALTAARQSCATHTAVAEVVKDVTVSDLFLDTVRTEQGVLYASKLRTAFRFLEVSNRCLLAVFEVYGERANCPIRTTTPQRQAFAEILNNPDPERVHPWIEECLAKGEPLAKALRLICLHSWACDGLRPKAYEQYKREIVQSYGISKLALLKNLESAEVLLVGRQPPSDMGYAAVRKAFNVLVDDVNETEPTDASYAWSGYAGILVRLVQYWLRPGWRHAQDALRRLPGPIGMEVKRPLHSQAADSPQPRIVLLVFVGGVTSAELSAMRFLADSTRDTQFVFLTTAMITGDRLIGSFDPDVGRGEP